MRVREWRDWLQERQLAPRSIAGYVAHVEALAESHKGRLDDLEPGEIERWLSEGGVAERTVAARHSALRSYYGFLVRNNLRPGNPLDFIERPRPPRPVPKLVVEAPTRIAKLKEPYRSVAQLIYESGMSAREVVAIELSPDQVGDEIEVGGRRVRLSPDAQRALQNVGGRVKKSVRAIERAFSKVGLSPSSLRHTFADELAEQGEDVETIAAALGLKNMATAKKYARRQPDDMGRVAEALERRRSPDRLRVVQRRHLTFEWNGTLRCERCGKKVDGPGPASADDCGPIPWTNGTFELRHIAGRPGEPCPRCGDPGWMVHPAGSEYVVTDAHEQDEQGRWRFYRSGRPAEPSGETVPPCGVVWHAPIMAWGAG